MAVKILLGFWVVTPCGIVGGYQCFRGNILIIILSIRVVGSALWGLPPQKCVDM